MEACQVRFMLPADRIIKEFARDYELLCGMRAVAEGCRADEQADHGHNGM